MDKQYVHEKFAKKMIEAHVNTLGGEQLIEVDFSRCPLAHFADNPNRLMTRAWSHLRPRDKWKKLS